MAEIKDKSIVEITPLEPDARISDLQKSFFESIRGETGFKDADQETQKEVTKVLDKIKDMRFKSVEDFRNITNILIKGVAPSLVHYIDIAIDKAKKHLKLDNKGVLVIYTGGTIGSAPKDVNDPKSPQIVKQWEELKYAIPNLDKLGFRVEAISFVNPLDSCNVGPQHWQKMAEIIKQFYKEYEGFVILHGTDTMVYTASALSFMLQELSKPVIITGSQIAGIVEIRNDAHQNFITSLMIANPGFYDLPVVPEVCIYFGGKLIRGCRSKKVDASGYEGFTSPNYPLLGVAGDHIDIDTIRLKPVTDSDKIELLYKLETNVITIDVFPGIQNSAVANKLLSDEKLRGVVLRSYGTGNIPTDESFIDPFSERTEKVVVVNVTQCQKGSVDMGLYETSQVLLDRGIIGGFDITPEAALCKLMILLGEYNNIDDIGIVKSLMQKSIAGEQKYSLFSTKFNQNGRLDKTKSTFRSAPAEIDSVEDYNSIDRALLRFINAKLEPDNGKDYLNIKIFVDLGENESTDESNDKYAGTFPKTKVPSSLLITAGDVGESLSFDISVKKYLLGKRHVTGPLRRAQKISFTIHMADQQGSFEWSDVELNLFVKEAGTI